MLSTLLLNRRMQPKMISSILALLFLVGPISPAASLERPLTIGFIGSLTSFAGNFGTAILEGAKLAAKEINQGESKVRIISEDDQSVARNSVGAYMKLTNADRIDAIIGGSWWINAIVKKAEKAGFPLVSCETLYNKETVTGKTYFLLQGELRSWVQVYEPIVKDRGFKRAAVVRFTSGFGETLEEEMKSLFSHSGRSFAGTIEYSDIQIPDAASIVLQLKKLKPDVVYIDGQPSGLANLLKRMVEGGLTNLPIFTNSIAEDVLRDKLINLSLFTNFYYTRRSTFDKDFSERFEKEYGKPPYLNADLGYFAVHILAEAATSGSEQNPSGIVAALKNGVKVKGRQFAFDEHNVFAGPPQEVWRIDQGQTEKVLGAEAP